MAEGGYAHDRGNDFQWSSENEENLQEQRDEVLVFQSLFEVEGDERFTVLNDGPNDILEDQVFSLQFLVPVKSVSDDITVNVCIPEEEEVGCNELHKTVVLQRSDSRNTVFASFHVKFLTPLKLLVILPPEYPSEAPPIFTLSCSWLNCEQLTSLCSQLDNLWNEFPSMPILNTWIDWLEHNTLSHMGIHDTVYIQQLLADDNLDTRAVPECDNIDDTVNEMLRYNIQEEMTEFMKYDQECNICFCEKSGKDFYRLLPCKHHFCKECLAEHSTLHVKEGTVQNLLCPESKCTTEIGPFILKELLSDKDYIRWEKLNLQHGLDMMGDIIYCPRCQNVVIKNEDLGHCLSCMFTFCTKCSEKWHQGDSCFFEKGEENAENSMKEKGDEDRDENLEQISDEAKKRLHIKRMRQIRESYKLIRANTKQCPHCRAPIEKNGGCNKITCTRCMKSMCWICGSDITKESYSHFITSRICTTFTHDFNDRANMRPVRVPTPQQVQDIERQIYIGGEEVRKNVARCPRCRQRNLRNHINKNNHMKCWNCKSNFCFLCNTLIMPPFTKHFTNSLCKQHSK